MSNGARTTVRAWLKWAAVLLLLVVVVAAGSVAYLLRGLLSLPAPPFAPGAARLPAPTGLYASVLGRYVNDPQVDLGLPFEDVTFAASDGTALRGWFVPGRSTSRVAVVLVHGAAADRRRFLSQVPVFHELGYPVLLFDCRNHGVSDGDGSGSSRGVNESEDVSSSVAFLKSRGFARVVAAGHSQGAGSAIIAAARDSAVDGVIASASWSDTPTFLSDAFVRQDVPRFAASLLATGLSWVSTVPAPGEVIGRIAPRPVLLIHGTADSAISSRNTENLFRRAGHPKQLWLAEDADHNGPGGVFEKYPEEFRRRVGTFLREFFALSP